MKELDLLKARFRNGDVTPSQTPQKTKPIKEDDFSEQVREGERRGEWDAGRADRCIVRIDRKRSRSKS